jgi:hypothetical protein
MSEINILESKTAILLNERDNHRNDLRDMIKGRHILIGEKQTYAKVMNIKVTGLGKDLEDVTIKLNLLEESYM